MGDFAQKKLKLCQVRIKSYDDVIMMKTPYNLLDTSPPIKTFFTNIHLLQCITIQPKLAISGELPPPIYQTPLQLERGEYLFCTQLHRFFYTNIFELLVKLMYKWLALAYLQLYLIYFEIRLFTLPLLHSMKMLKYSWERILSITQHLLFELVFRVVGMAQKRGSTR